MSAHGFELETAKPAAPPSNPAVGAAGAALDLLNRLLMRLSMLAMIATSLVLTYSVVTRYLFRSATDWQDEVAVFMLVGATFICAAWVQGARGHIGIEALSSILPPSVNRVRLFLVDLFSLLFCAFFSWKSWTLFHEALNEGQTTSSTLGSPLWIPYSLMAFGMTLLTLQILLQIAAQLTQRKTAP
ncbi:TRAP transporter small permease [Noviherbaspirillum galbum]|uniref:TRAP transporter small permease n=1 Tax=Noviherbaspirillum galbum TaxID=2709383 RepID=UPI0038B2750E